LTGDRPHGANVAPCSDVRQSAGRARTRVDQPTGQWRGRRSPGTRSAEPSWSKSSGRAGRAAWGRALPRSGAGAGRDAGVAGPKTAWRLAIIRSRRRAHESVPSR
jgi:hypothetical protein